MRILNFTDGFTSSNAPTITAISRAVIAAGTANHVVINAADGTLSSEAQLAKSRGGTGADNSSVTFPASGTITTEESIAASTNLDLATSNTISTVDIGTGTGANTINIGGANTTVNISGTVNNQNVTNLDVDDKLITINKGGASSSGGSAGIEVEENGSATGYAQTSSDRNSWKFKAPNSAGITSLTPGSSDDSVALLAASQTLTNKSISGSSNTLTNIARASVSAGTASHVLINDGSGLLSSEATLAKSRGGTGADNSSVTFPASGTIPTNSSTSTFTNKTLDVSNVITVRDDRLTIADDADNTKLFNFNASGIPTGTQVTYSTPAQTTTLVGRDTTDTLTNKTINASNNTVSNIARTHLAASFSAGIWINAKEYGAVGDGSTDDHTAIQNALNAAAGGTLYIPSGTYRKAQQGGSNVSWTIASNTTVIMAPDCLIKSELGIDNANCSTAVFRNSNYSVSTQDSNITIIGGRIQQGSNAFSGSTFISMKNVKNFTLKDTKLLDIGGWFRVNLVMVTKAVIEGVRIDYEQTGWTGTFIGAGGGVPPTVTQSSQYQWEDGIHIGTGCNNILVSNCYINSGDDAIAVNAEPYFGASDATDLNISDIVISNCVLKSNSAQALRVYVESSMTTSTVNRVLVSNCRMTGGSGGDGVIISDATHTSLIGEVALSNCYVYGTGTAQHGINCAYATGLLFSNVYVFNAYQKGVNLDNCSRVTLTGCRVIENQSGSVYDGVYATSGTNIQIQGGEYSYFNGSGITFNDITSGSICGAYINNNGVDGISLKGTTSYVTISNCRVTANTGIGIKEYNTANHNQLTNNTLDGNTAGRYTVVGADSGIPRLRGDNVFCSFIVQIRNNGGTIEHRYVAAGGVDGAASKYTGSISNASATYQTTPTVDNTTGFGSVGGGISAANTNEFVLDTPAQTASSCALIAVMGYEATSATDILILPQIRSTNISGLGAVNRIYLRLFSSGSSAFNITTGNITAGQEIRIQVFGYMQE
jgi:polygalacturonase